MSVKEHNVPQGVPAIVAAFLQTLEGLPAAVGQWLEVLRRLIMQLGPVEVKMYLHNELHDKMRR